jgi:hypothetical protein
MSSHSNTSFFLENIPRIQKLLFFLLRQFIFAVLLNVLRGFLRRFMEARVG